MQQADEECLGERRVSQIGPFFSYRFLLALLASLSDRMAPTDTLVVFESVTGYSLYPADVSEVQLWSS